jgi:hypothetical protein
LFLDQIYFNMTNLLNKLYKDTLKIISFAMLKPGC